MNKKTDLREWIDEGVEPLDEKMQETLDEPGQTIPEPDPFETPHPREMVTYEHFHEWSHTRGERILHRIYGALAVLICAGLSILLISTAVDLPQFGSADTLIDNEVSTFYVEEGVEHTNAANIITGIILDFRGFDTLGESHVLFIAVCTVLILLHVRQGDDEDAARERLEAEADDRHFEPKHDLILQNAARQLVPLIMVLGMYILLAGHLGPGGGFSGGAVIGAGLILYLNAFGFQPTERFFTFKVFRTISYLALTFYCLCKGYVFFTGANGIENVIPTGTFGNIFSGGLLMPLSVAVGLVVACTMYALFTLFRKGDM